MTAVKVTDEMGQVLVRRPTGAIPIEDDQMQIKNDLLSKEDYFRLHDDYIRRELQVAFDQVDRGEVSDLDIVTLLAEANRRYDLRL
jgi:hypothetical protein